MPRDGLAAHVSADGGSDESHGVYLVTLHPKFSPLVGDYAGKRARRIFEKQQGVLGIRATMDRLIEREPPYVLLDLPLVDVAAFETTPGAVGSAIATEACEQRSIWFRSDAHRPFHAWGPALRTAKQVVDGVFISRGHPPLGHRLVAIPLRQSGAAGCRVVGEREH